MSAREIAAIRTKSYAREKNAANVERLAVLGGLVLDRLDALALDRPRDDRRRAARRRQRLLVRAVDRLDVVSVDLDRRPAGRLGAPRVRREIPPVHRLAALAQA